MHSAQVGRMDRKRVDWIGLTVLGGIVGILLWMTVASVRQSARYKSLSRAATSGNIGTVRALIVSGRYTKADISNALIDGMNAPSSAKKHAVVLLFLEQGANPNGRANGMSPLGWAVQNDDIGSLRVLLDHGADPNGPSWYGSVLNAALQMGHTDAAILLLDKGADLKRAANNGNPPLNQAMQLGSDKLVRKLLEKGASVNDVSAGTGQPALAAAVSQGRADWVALLLKHGANVDVRDATRLTPLMQAAQLGRTDIAKVLLDAGADVNADNGSTCVLAYAVLKGKADTVRLLLQHGADPNGKGNPLQYAGSHPDIARMLKQAGATQ